MMLYTVYAGWGDSLPKLCELQVEKETAKTYVLSGRDAAAGYSKVVPKEGCPFALTPEDAWANYKANLALQIENVQSRLNMLHQRLADAQKEAP